MDAAQDVKSRLDVVDIVQGYLPLKIAGSGSFRGLCPFHHEKTPSFYANRPRQTWHCFGCNEGGDVISFVMKMEGMEFREALELLAQKAGVVLPAFDARTQSLKKRLFEINDLAARWFRNVLLDRPDAEHARAYLAKRGVDELTADVWRIGYAPADWRELSNFLRQKDVTEQEMIDAGLSIARQGQGGIYDRFRDRLMFAICDVHGNTVGFTGRILNDTVKEAKYVNTPETAVYRKKDILFGLDKAKGEIKRQDMAIIVEGNMDAITAHQFGISNVVASSGTALTSEQLALLKRFTSKLAIAFDADAAGNAATIRGLDLARSMDFSLRVIITPPGLGKDPDEAIRKDKDVWKEAVRQAPGILEWLYRHAFRGRDVSRPEEKKYVAQMLLPELKRIVDPVERDGWLSRLAEDLNIGVEALRESLKNTRMDDVVKKPLEVTKKEAISAPLQLAVAKTMHEQLLERIACILELRPELRPLADSILTEYPMPQELDPERSSYLLILADREFEDQSTPALQRELESTIKRVRLDHYKTRLDELQRKVNETERLGSDRNQIDVLLQECQRIQSLLIQLNS